MSKSAVKSKHRKEVNALLEIHRNILLSQVNYTFDLLAKQLENASTELEATKLLFPTLASKTKIPTTKVDPLLIGTLSHTELADKFFDHIQSKPELKHTKQSLMKALHLTSQSRGRIQHALRDIVEDGRCYRVGPVTAPHYVAVITTDKPYAKLEDKDYFMPSAGGKPKTFKVAPGLSPVSKLGNILDD